tara:strand:+ start:55 stop:327 length:273 start_codon:yes stop_codon:yes gene_type:complete
LSLDKKTLSKELSNKLRLSQKDSLSIVSSFFNYIADNRKNDLNINNFGSFREKKTPERIGRNPKTLENFTIKARVKMSFQPSTILKKLLN